MLTDRFSGQLNEAGPVLGQCLPPIYHELAHDMGFLISWRPA